MSTVHVMIALVAVTGGLWDLRTRRIPNYLTFGCTVLAFAYALVTGGWPGLGTSAAGWVVGFLLFLPFFLLRGMGGGDVKLLAALGAWFGPAGMLVLAFYTAMAGGVIALGVVLARGYFSTAFKNLWLLLCHWSVIGLKPVPEISLENPRAPRLPYGVAIAVGALTTLWLE
ncbi:MAG TPA: prepilin peptidase [Vicinamibacterales bacterium]|nr:prepilin peptidase [Vicinamibacterales bacterium]